MSMARTRQPGGRSDSDPAVPTSPTRREPERAPPTRPSAGVYCTSASCPAGPCNRPCRTRPLGSEGVGAGFPALGPPFDGPRFPCADAPGVEVRGGLARSIRGRGRSTAANGSRLPTSTERTTCWGVASGARGGEAPPPAVAGWPLRGLGSGGSTTTSCRGPHATSKTAGNRPISPYRRAKRAERPHWRTRPSDGSGMGVALNEVAKSIKVGL